MDDKTQFKIYGSGTSFRPGEPVYIPPSTDYKSAYYILLGYCLGKGLGEEVDGIEGLNKILNKDQGAIE